MNNQIPLKDPNLIDKFIPIFLLTILIEAVVSHFSKSRKNYYKLNDTLNNLACGILSQIQSKLFKNLLIVPYIYIWEKYKIYPIEINNWNWIIFLLLVDLGYYIGHSGAHKINFFWSGHVSHHSSEFMNFSTALRQGGLEWIFSFVFYLPLALFFSPFLFLYYKQINTIFQFWVHTKFIYKLPYPIEFFFNTPSHHRVHHSRNPKYIDKNFAGMFVIWDRIFGTFQEEEEECVFGLVHPLNNWNPVWAQFHHFYNTCIQFYKALGIKNKFKTLFYPPGWYLNEKQEESFEPIPQVSSINCSYYNEDAVSKTMKVYLFVQFSLVFFMNGISEKTNFSSFFTFFFIFYTFYSLMVIGFFFENRPQIFYFEITRICFQFFLLQELLLKQNLILKEWKKNQEVIFFVTVFYTVFHIFYLVYSYSVESKMRSKLEKLK